MSSNHYYPAAYQSPYRFAANPYHAPLSGHNNVLELATMGAVVGSSIAAAKAIHQVQHNEISTQQALANTATAAMTAAAATAVASVAANALTHNNLARLGVLFLAGSAVMYGMDRRLTNKEE